MVILILPSVTIGLASNTAEALVLMERRAPDLLITDDQMTAVGGMTFVGLLRSRQFTFPILIISASSSQVPEPFTAGRTSFLPKPFTAAALRRSLNGLLRPQP
jgi:CheY-like chemotaxis protein